MITLVLIRMVAMAVKRRCGNSFYLFKFFSLNYSHWNFLIKLFMMRICNLLLLGCSQVYSIPGICFTRTVLNQHPNTFKSDSCLRE